MTHLEDEVIFSAGQGWWLSPDLCSVGNLAIPQYFEGERCHSSKEAHQPAKITHFSHGAPTGRSPYASVCTIEQRGCSPLTAQ